MWRSRLAINGTFVYLCKWLTAIHKSFRWSYDSFWPFIISNDVISMWEWSHYFFTLLVTFSTTSSDLQLVESSSSSHAHTHKHSYYTLPHMAHRIWWQWRINSNFLCTAARSSRAYHKAWWCAPDLVVQGCIEEGPQQDPGSMASSLSGVKRSEQGQARGRTHVAVLWTDRCLQKLWRDREGRWSWVDMKVQRCEGVLFMVDCLIWMWWSHMVYLKVS